ncbi:hypothetical protein HELRODRAFT_168357 [Helobdella robusta]|uniref:Uncharacterized protein n=1 Tax=Helobdella robusta TaxID=6412 RepID=T1F0G6_HELRO|nr:hypothetical protein HELRODRAFT_168357 [Helobdella robusta]ESO09376.1 hypothetical protein HELRODRAFT_168357 [Helobdella robusta]
MLQSCQMFNPNDYDESFYRSGFILNGNNNNVGSNQTVKFQQKNEIVKIWSHFASLTTSHGIPHIDHARGVKFLKYGVDVKFSVEQANPMTFPAVTVCNNNPIKKSSVAGIQRLNNSIISYNNDIESLICSNNISYLSKQPVNAPNSSKCIVSSGSSEDGKQEKIDFKMRKIVQEIYYEMRSTDIYSKGHIIDDLVVDCRFSGKYCFGDFTTMYNIRYGNCYTFNAAEEGKPLKTINYPGPNNGLSIIFNVEQDEYIGEVTQYAGLRVVVHDPKKMPFPDDEGILVPPNALTHIGVQLETVSRLNESYGKCNSNDNPIKTNYQLTYNKSYCQKGCEYTCLGKEVIDRCKCKAVKYAVFPANEDPIRTCQSQNKSDEECMAEVTQSSENGSSQCNNDCPKPCQENIYVISISTSMWPSENYKATLMKILEKHHDIFPRELNDSDYFIDSNYGRLVVYYSTLAYTQTSETPSYELKQFLSDIGGILGLYIGFSVLTFVEFIELIYDICLSMFTGGCSRKKYKIFHKKFDNSSFDYNYDNNGITNNNNNKIDNLNKVKNDTSNATNCNKIYKNIDEICDGFTVNIGTVDVD